MGYINEGIRETDVSKNLRKAVELLSEKTRKHHYAKH